MPFPVRIISELPKSCFEKCGSPVALAGELSLRAAQEAVQAGIPEEAIGSMEGYVTCNGLVKSGLFGLRRQCGMSGYWEIKNNEEKIVYRCSAVNSTELADLNSSLQDR